MKHSVVLAVDATINVVLGVLLIAFSRPLVDALGVPASYSAFYPNLLGGVLVGIGIALIMPILQRLRLSSQTWVETVLNFGRWFRLVAGRVDSLAAEAARRGRRWLQGVSHSRAAFA